MISRSWGTSADGSLEYFSYDPKYHHDGVFYALEKAFYAQEQVCKAVGVSSDPQAVKELNELVEHCLKDGVSIVAVDKLKGKVAGAAINKIQVKSVETEAFFAAFAKNCKSAKSREILQVMFDVDDNFDLFEIYKVDCLIDLMFLTVLPEYMNKKIGETLTKKTIELAKKLSDGENVKVPVDDRKLSLEPTPKLVFALFTSEISQKVGYKCGFETVATLLYKDYHSAGKAWAANIEKQHPSIVVAYKLP